MYKAFTFLGDMSKFHAGFDRFHEVSISIGDNIGLVQKMIAVTWHSKLASILLLLVSYIPLFAWSKVESRYCRENE